MTYCRKCSRLLESDMEQCPYCGNQDDAIQASESDGSFESKLNEMNAQSDASSSFDDNIQSNVNELDTIFEDPGLQNPQPVQQYNNNYTGGRPYEGVVVEPQEEQVSTGLKVVLIILSIFIPLVGIIVGIVFMSNKKSKSYRSFGLVLLILGIAITVISIIGCCVFSMAAGILSEIAAEL